MVASSLEKITSINSKNIRTDLPSLDVGDTIKMRIKVKEADKIRIHAAPWPLTYVPESWRSPYGAGNVFAVATQ